MRRIVALVAVTLTLGLAGCADTENTTPSADGPGEWFTTTDPVTGREFRCQLWWRKSGYAGGLASWCYTSRK